jgi:hypothetical protein
MPGPHGELPPIRMGRSASAKARDAMEPMEPEPRLRPAPPTDEAPGVRLRAISGRTLARAASGDMDSALTKLMVWGIGGKFESKEALSAVFKQYGAVKDAVSSSNTPLQPRCRRSCFITLPA